MLKHILAVVLSLGLLLSSIAAEAGERFFTIGTGGVTGVYYPTGEAIASIFNAGKSEHNMRATVEATAASVFNINAVIAGDLDFGIAQSDRQYQAYNGLDEWKDKPQRDLCAVFSLASEEVTFVAADDSGIVDLKSAAGKTISIGNLGSGNRQNAIDVFGTVGLDYRKDFKTENIKAEDAPRMMQDGSIDGFFYTVSHPNANIKEALSGKRKAHLVPITGMEPLLQRFPYYSKANIAIKAYPEAKSQEDVPTVSMPATLVTSAAQPDDVVYHLTKSVFENLETLKTLHPALADLTKEGMLKGLTAPIHPGALKYYKEAGLIK